MLSKQQLNKITKWQIKRQKEFISVPESGIKIEYLGKQFIVYKNVFWPSEDSKPLVENLIVNQGEHVLDVGTGSGVIAIFSVYKEAEKVVAIDINPDAVRAAKANAELHGFSNIIDVRLSDMFDNIKEVEQFDVITCNLPFRNKPAHDLIEASQWDTDLHVHRKFFAGVGKCLKPNGRIYLSQASYGAVDEMKKLAELSGFSVRLICQKPMPINVPGMFYAFELRRK